MRHALAARRGTALALLWLAVCAGPLLADQGASYDSRRIASMEVGIFCRGEVGASPSPESGTIKGTVERLDGNPPLVKKTRTVPAIDQITFGVEAQEAVENGVVTITVTHPPLGPGRVTTERWETQMDTAKHHGPHLLPRIVGRQPRRALDDCRGRRQQDPLPGRVRRRAAQECQGPVPQQGKQLGQRQPDHIEARSRPATPCVQRRNRPGSSRVLHPIARIKPRQRGTLSAAENPNRLRIRQPSRRGATPAEPPPRSGTPPPAPGSSAACPPRSTTGTPASGGPQIPDTPP